ncbi:hypothetical protein CNY89_30255, partial [Amaricoccus sp. HAR-UPW-R2A-40]
VHGHRHARGGHLPVLLQDHPGQRGLGRAHPQPAQRARRTWASTCARGTPSCSPPRPSRATRSRSRASSTS